MLTRLALLPIQSHETFLIQLKEKRKTKVVNPLRKSLMWESTSITTKIKTTWRLSIPQLKTKVDISS